MLHVEDSLLGACFIELFGCAVFGMVLSQIIFPGLLVWCLSLLRVVCSVVFQYE